MVLSRRRGGGRSSTCDARRVAEVLGALANPNRLEIVRLLGAHEHDVTELAACLGISVANTSHHLARLRRAGLVTSRREGTHVTNRLAARDVTQVTGAACAVVRNRS